MSEFKRLTTDFFSRETIVLGKRIGIAYAEEDKDRLLRYALEQEV